MYLYGDDKEYLDISITCYSEKVDASIGFGFSIEATENVLGEQFELDILLMQEAFWENYYEYEPGVEMARSMMKDNPSLTYKQALREVFGHFKIAYQVDGQEMDGNLEFDADIEECMYSMIELIE